MRTNTSRRHFLKTAVAAGAAIGFPTVIPASALGRGGAVAPSGRVSVGLIGCGGRSRVAKEYLNYEKSQLVGVCDPIRERREKWAAEAGDCVQFNDFRDLLARDDIDAVHVVTADHWHVPISLAAARAGKDMYTEKPLGISIEQDLAARAIVEKHKRIFQYGTQQRSMEHMRKGIELVLNGHIGALKEIHVWAPHGASGGSATPVLPVPDGYDFDLWLGPAPEAPFCEDRCLVQGARNGIFHIYDYALGFIAGWGAHPVDQLQWWADAAGMEIPVSYLGRGTIPTEELFDTLTHWDVECVYANGLKMRFLDDETARKEGGVPNLEKVGRFGNCTMFIGEQGWVAVSRNGWEVFPEPLKQKAEDAGPKQLPVSGQHQRNFIDAVLSRRQPVANLTSAVQSDLICQLSDISIRTGRAIQWDPKREAIVGDAEAGKRMRRPMRKPWRL